MVAQGIGNFPAGGTFLAAIHHAIKLFTAEVFIAALHGLLLSYSPVESWIQARAPGE